MAEDKPTWNPEHLAIVKRVEANLSHANLSGADLSRANLAGADLRVRRT